MRVHKDLFGDGSKINANEIAVTPELLLSNAVIVESGNDGDGYYERWGNGFQLCSLSKVFTFDTSTEVGALYTSDILTWNHPKEFISPPKFWGVGEGGASRLIITPRLTFREKTEFYVNNVINRKDLNARLFLYTIGRWK